MCVTFLCFIPGINLIFKCILRLRLYRRFLCFCRLCLRSFCLRCLGLYCFRFRCLRLRCLCFRCFRLRYLCFRCLCFRCFRLRCLRHWCFFCLRRFCYSLRTLNCFLFRLFCQCNAARLYRHADGKHQCQTLLYAISITHIYLPSLIPVSLY